MYDFLSQFLIVSQKEQIFKGILKQTIVYQNTIIKYPELLRPND